VRDSFWDGDGSGGEMRRRWLVVGDACCGGAEYEVGWVGKGCCEVE
jgi:hypothetical protein